MVQKIADRMWYFSQPDYSLADAEGFSDSKSPIQRLLREYIARKVLRTREEVEGLLAILRAATTLYKESADAGIDVRAEILKRSHEELGFNIDIYNDPPRMGMQGTTAREIVDDVTSVKFGS